MPVSKPKRADVSKIRVATWKDPALSVHPSRGGPKFPPSPGTVRAFVPRYRVRPEPVEKTDDEDDGKDDPKKDEPVEGRSIIPSRSMSY
jgi:hypothetical protein